VKATDLIEKLNELVLVHGDCEVFVGESLNDFAGRATDAEFRDEFEPYILIWSDN
jgi:hypothetical protein